MTKNTIAAVVLSVAFLILWNQFYRPTINQNQNAYRPEAGGETSKSRMQNGNVAPLATKEKAPGGRDFALHETLVVENENTRITFTSAGGAIKKYELKKAKKTSSEISDSAEENNYTNIIPADEGLLFATTHIDETILSEARIYRKENNVFSEQTAEVVTKGGKEKYLIRKTYHLSAAKNAPSYLEGLDIEIIPQSLRKNILADKKATDANQTEQPKLLMVFSKGLVEKDKGAAADSDEKENISLNSFKYLPSVGKKVHKLKSSELVLIEKNVSTLWVAADNRYYIAALIPLNKEKDFNPNDRVSIKQQGKNTYPVVKMSLAAGDNLKRNFKVYIGGKSLQTLKRIAPHLEKTIDFGMMGGLGKFFLESLISIKKFTNNYGWAIVILSLAIQIITLPLSLKSLKATADMKRLQPLMRDIQTKYKDDPKRMNVEMMNLYKTHKVNPLSGCLPMLLQMPIFWALFTTLRNAYELKDAPWILWIKDLSAHDPIYILPILMGLGMFGQQFMSGATSDPQNKMMGYIFPAVFTFMFLKFPSGVVLYWLINSILTISIQFFFLEKEIIKEHREIVHHK